MKEQDNYKIQSSNDLLSFLISQANSDVKNWFGFKQQRIAGIDIAYKIAIAHADKMTADEVVQYVVDLNNSIYHKIIKG